MDRCDPAALLGLPLPRICTEYSAGNPTCTAIMLELGTRSDGAVSAAVLSTLNSEKTR